MDIAVLDGDRAVHIAEVRGPAAISSLGWLGRGIPLHATAGGKVLLAHAPEGVQEAVLSSELERFTAATANDPGVLEKEIGRILDRGWGSTAGEYEVGLNGVAAPVRGADGRVVAAISVSGPSFRMATEVFHAFAERTIVGADELSRRLRVPG